MAGKLLSIIALVTVLSTAVYGQTWGPWSTSGDAPALRTEADRETSPPKRSGPTEYSVAGAPFVWLVKLYQRHISPIDGDRCPMYPTCSQYGIQAMHKHGPLIGIVMTADRLMHEADERDFAPARKVGNRYRFIDPVENNDFWWYKK
jgi:putative membrane protein insertion efficiency factor